jgi:hypothetical protein
MAKKTKIGTGKEMDAENPTTPIPLCSHPLSYSHTLIYIPSPFLKKYPSPPTPLLLPLA